MRPIPWIIRVGLFAVGFGAGLSHYRAPATQRPVVIEFHIVNSETPMFAGAEPATSGYLPCPVPASDDSASQILSASN